MKDPIPPGFIYFPEVWERFHRAKWKGDSPLDKGESSDEEIEIWRTAAEEEIAAPFRNGDLKICVRFPRKKVKTELPPSVCRHLPTSVFRTGMFTLKFKDRTPFTEEAKFEIWLRLYLKEYRTIEQLAFELAEANGVLAVEVSDAIFYAIVRGEFDGHMLHKSGYPDFRSKDLYDGFISFGPHFDPKFSPVPLSQFSRLPYDDFCKDYGEIFRKLC